MLAGFIFFTAVNSCRASHVVESISATFEADLVRAVEVVVGLPDGDQKMDLLHVRPDIKQKIIITLYFKFPVLAVPAEDTKG